MAEICRISINLFKNQLYNWVGPQIPGMRTALLHKSSTPPSPGPIGAYLISCFWKDGGGRDLCEETLI